MEKPLPVHAVRGLAEGYEHQGRWMRLARAALDDLLAEHGPLGPTTIGLVVLHPRQDDGRCPTVLDRGEFGDLLRTHGQRHGAVFDCRLVEGAGSPLAEGLHVVQRELGRSWSQAILLGVDSLIDFGSLSWLARSGALKSEENPVGIVPGEGAACFLIESGQPRPEDRPTLARVTGWSAIAATSDPLDAEALGASIARQVSRQLAAQLDPSAGWDLVTDHGGDELRARLIGSLMCNLDRSVGDPRMHHPATSFGSVGTASAFLGLAVALHVVTRRRGSGTAIVLATDARTGSEVVLVRRT